jgi:hypothetical protein
MSLKYELHHFRLVYTSVFLWLLSTETLQTNKQFQTVSILFVIVWKGKISTMHIFNYIINLCQNNFPSHAHSYLLLKKNDRLYYLICGMYIIIYLQFWPFSIDHGQDFHSQFLFMFMYTLMAFIWPKFKSAAFIKFPFD